MGSVSTVEIGNTSALIYALSYASLCWPVLPIKTGDKIPLGGQGINHATTDAATIREWWKRWPHAGIGIRLDAAGLCAIDIDPRNGATVTPADFPPTLTARTGGDGHHLIYRVPTGIKLPGKLGPGIDIKCRGYIVVEPSLHPSEKRYQWVDWDPLFADLAGPPDIAEFPAELLSQLKPASSAKSAGDIDDLERAMTLAAVTDETVEDVRSALACFDATDADEYDFWLRMGQALKSLEQAGRAEARALWHEFSARSPRYDHDEAEAKWISFDPRAISYRSIFHEATAKKQWANPRRGVAPTSTLTAAEVIVALRTKPKEEIVRVWAAQTSRLPHDAAEEVIDEVHRLTGVKVRALNRALQDERALNRREHKETATRRRIGRRKLIQYEPENRTAHADEVERLFVNAARPGECVSFGGVLASVIEKQVPYTHMIGDDAEAAPHVPQIEPLDAVGVLAKIESIAAFYDGDSLLPVPQSIVEIVLKKRVHVAPRINGLVTHPIVLPDGSILSKDGLDESTGLFLYGASVPEMRSYTQQEAAEAVTRLKADLFGEFEFASPLDADIALAALLTGVQRRVLDAAPGLAVLAAQQSSGKTTLVRTIHILLVRRDMPVSTFPENDEAEVQKRLLSMLLRSPALVCFDNITDGTTFRSSAIAAVMTGPVLVQRVLGVSREAECPTNVLLAITGNNLALGPDELTRWMVCRLAPSDARPHERTFRHPDVLANVLRMREGVLRDVIGIVAGFLTSGEVSAGGSRFPRWDRMVRQPLLWAGTADVADVFRANVDASEDAGACMGVLKALRVIFGDSPFYAAQVSTAASTDWEMSGDELPTERIGVLDKAEARDLKTRLVTSLETLRAKDVRSARSVGRVLRSIVGRPVVIAEDGSDLEVRLEGLPMSDGVARYRVSARECI